MPLRLLAAATEEETVNLELSVLLQLVSIMK
jgi:hypothetical protein